MLIGVSNYLRSQVQSTFWSATDLHALGHIECHEYLQRGNDHVPWLRQHRTQVGSFKGLTPAFQAPDGSLQQLLALIANAHDTSHVVALLAWIIQSNIVAVATTRKPERPDDHF
ncbi:hypothetical protein BKA67DRAFT_88964 [Truncatella angustata]|uniref:Uncharacterized protein n=1 Tax=Truncatella angustata TaxID=152316 RepID=A0A9P8RM48_9PEZI|nr:uncharacterized protein BKA67DRAFT_88964 [Truncatella angustata]KAH6645900.1 hypothetical protein BKA67DRAFT_88964 [Truncatella angustata]